MHNLAALLYIFTRFTGVKGVTVNLGRRGGSRAGMNCSLLHVFLGL